MPAAPRPRGRPRRPAVAVAVAVAVVGACGTHGPTGPTTAPPTAPLTTAPLTTAPLTTAPPPPAPSVVTTAPLARPPAPVRRRPPPLAGPAVVEVRYRVERRTIDVATADFAAVVEATLSDTRGWRRAGFDLVAAADGPFLVVLGEGAEVDRLCLPYDTYGQYSCQNGPVVAINADRWRWATTKWTGDLDTYRRMVVNHEVGHLLGQRHPRSDCPRPRRPAPVMGQQSTELRGCLPNPWPLDHEVAAAARHDQALAPGFER